MNLMKSSKYRIGKKWRKWWIYVFSGILILFTCFPFFWMISSSLRTEKELYSIPPLFFPKTFTISGYSYLFEGTDFALWFKNSCLITASVVIGVTLVAFLGGYSLSRFNYRGKKVISHSMIVLNMRPPMLIAVPLLLLLMRVRLTNSHLGVIIAFISAQIPFCTWLLWGFIQGIPRELEDAARVDGASTLRVLLSIVFPLSRPGIIAVGVFAFVASWVNFTYPFILLMDSDLNNLPLGIARIYSESIFTFRLNTTMAVATLAVLPVLMIFLVLQKFLIRGWGIGAVMEE